MFTELVAVNKTLLYYFLSTEAMAKLSMLGGHYLAIASFCFSVDVRHACIDIQ